MDLDLEQNYFSRGFEADVGEQKRTLTYDIE